MQLVHCRPAPPALPPRGGGAPRRFEVHGGEHGDELIVLGQFALRKSLTQQAQPQPPRLPLHAAPAPELAEPSWASVEPRGPMLLPTEGYLALRTATASHRKAAYVAYM